jgi:hypothetical protein
MQSFGLSDAAEAFVLIAGFAAMMAYAGHFERDGMLAGARRIGHPLPFLLDLPQRKPVPRVALAAGVQTPQRALQPLDPYYAITHGSIAEEIPQAPRGGILDGAQSAGAIPLAVDEIGADFYAVSGQKWLLGPDGTGALAVGRGVVGSVLPPVGGYLAASTPYAVGREALWPDARRIETAGLHKPSIVGLARSAGWLSMFAGLPWAHERAARLAAGAAERMAGTPGVTLATPRARMATLVSFRVAGWSAEEVAVALGRRVHAIVCSIAGLDVVRLSVAFFTTDDELRRVLDAVEEVAAHTPATLPALGRTRRPCGSPSPRSPGGPGN